MIKLVKMECPSCGGVLKKKGFGNYNCPYCGMDYKMDMDIIVPAGEGTGKNSKNSSAPQSAGAGKNAAARIAAILAVSIIAAVLCVIILSKDKSESSIKKPTAAVKVTPAAKGISSPYFQQLVTAAFEKDYSQVSTEELARISYLDLLTDSRKPVYRINDGELKTAEIEYDGRIQYGDLALFTGLKTLKFDAYKDYGSVLSGMTELEELECRFSPNVLLKYLPSPEKLKVFGCYYSDDTIGEMGKLANLEKLSLKYYSTSLSKEKTPDLSEIARLTKLTDIYLDLDDYMVLPFMSSLTNLKSVNIHCDTLKDISFLENMPGLESLTLVKCDILNLDSLKSVPKLKVLRLEDCYKTDGYEIVPTLTELEELMLSYYHGQVIPEDFSSLKKVTRLILDGFNDISFLSQFPNVRYLRLYGCNYSNFGAAACMKGLKELKLGGGTSLCGLGFLLEMKELEKVDFSGIRAGTDTEKLFLIPNLKELDLSNTELAMDLNVIRENDSLECLKLDNLKWKAYNEPTYIGDRKYIYKDWDKLNLTECMDFLSNFPNLKELSLEGNELQKLNFLKGLDKLEKLNITNTYVNDVSLLNSLPKLRELTCGENPILSKNLDERIKADYDSKPVKLSPFNHYDW